MKFGVTSKSGYSVIIEAPNYKAAQKEAERRFGKGVIVQLVVNTSTNPIVANALSVAKNAGGILTVTLETVTFEKGVRRESRNMAINKLESLVRKLGIGGEWQNLLSYLTRHGGFDIAIGQPTLAAKQN